MYEEQKQILNAVLTKIRHLSLKENLEQDISELLPAIKDMSYERLYNIQVAALRDTVQTLESMKPEQIDKDIFEQASYAVLCSVSALLTTVKLRDL